MAGRRAAGERGFTLIELMVVVTIIGILAGLATIQVRYTLQRTKENTLRHNLRVMRDVIQQYKVDKKRYPAAPEDLVDPAQPYLKEIPVDPITDSRDTWEWIQKEPDDPDDPNADTGIQDVKSGAPGNDLDGVPFTEY